MVGPDLKRKPGALILLAISLLCFCPSLAAEDPSWSLYQDGLRAFAEKRFGDALNAWQDAVKNRKERFGRTSELLRSALTEPAALRAKDSVRRLIQGFASEGFSERDIAQVKAEAGGSLKREVELWRAKNPSKAFFDFLLAADTVFEARGSAGIEDSLKALLETSALLERYPEAEFGIGRVFLAEGESRLAEFQFRLALDCAASLETPPLRYEIIDALASVARSRGLWKDYEDWLRQDLAGSEIFSPRNDFLRQAMKKALVVQGIDSFLAVYRIDEVRIARPAAELGEFLLRNGRSEAVTHLAIAVNALVTRGIARLREEEPSFSFDRLQTFWAKARADKELSAWLEEAGLRRDLYYLGEALLVEGSRESARGIFGILSAAGKGDAWAEASRLALRRPAGSPATTLP